MGNFISYPSAEYTSMLGELSASPKKIIVAGTYRTNRLKCVAEILKVHNGKAIEISLAEYIIPNLEQSKQNIDRLFPEIADSPLVIFKNPEYLCGVYNAHSYSVEKYATPHEKYFLEKLESIKGSVVLEFEDEYYLDKSLIRKADSVIRVSKPASWLSKLSWSLEKITVNGSAFPTKRPART